MVAFEFFSEVCESVRRDLHMEFRMGDIHFVT